MARITADQLRKLQKKHVTDEAIGAIFGVTRQAIHRLRQQYEIASVPARHDRRNTEILHHYNKGISGIELAKRYGISVSQCFRILDAQKQKKKKRRRP